MLFWFSRRRYSDPIHKIIAKYFISTQIKESNLSFFNCKYIELFTTISKDEVAKSELYASTENDERDNQQYLVDILKLNNPINEDYLNFMKESLDIFFRNESKEIKQMNYISHLFFRVIIRFIYLFTSQIEQNTSPIPDSSDSPQLYSNIINISFRIFKQYESDILVLLKQFFVCILTKSDFIMSKNSLRLFACIVHQQLLEYIRSLPFSIDFHIFLFSALINYFEILKNQMKKAELLPEEIENMKQLIIYISDNFKTISQKYSSQTTTFFDILLNTFLLFPLNNCELYYSLGFCSLSFLKNSIIINSNFILNNHNFLNTILYLIWSADNFPIESFPQPTFQYTDNCVNSISLPRTFLNFEFIDSPPLFSKRNGGYLKPISETIIPEQISNSFDLFTEILMTLNSYEFQKSVFVYLSKLLIKSIETDHLPLNSKHDFNTILFYISYLFSYIGLKLNLKSTDHPNFVILFNKFFYLDNKSNHQIHSFFRFFIFCLFEKIFDADPILVIDGFQQVLNESQLHICDEVFIFFSFLLKKNPVFIIDNITKMFYPRFFYLLKKLNENRNSMFYFIHNLFSYDEGRTKFLSYERFVESIFTFLFSEQTKKDVTDFILTSYEKENDLNCLDIVYKVSSLIFDHSKLPDKKWIDFFINFVNILNPIISKSRKLNVDSEQYSQLFESLKKIFCSLNNKEEKCLIAPFLNLITIFTSNNDLYRKRCLNLYTTGLSIFDNISIENIDDDIIKAMINHIFEYNEYSIIDPRISKLLFKNANAITFLHNCTKNYKIHKKIFEILESCFCTDLANQVLLSQSNFPFVLIDFLKNNMEHPSFPLFLQLFDNVFTNNFDVKHFLYLFKPPENNSIENLNNWKRYSFQIIEALSARDEKDLSLRYAFLNGEKTEIYFVDEFQFPFEIKLNFFIRSYPKKHCDLISFFSKTKQISDLFSIKIDHEGKLFITFKSYNEISNLKPRLIYKIETEIQISKNRNIELVVNFSNNTLNFNIKEDEKIIKNNDQEETENGKLYEVKCQFPDFLTENKIRISFFNSAKKAKKHSICVFMFYFSLSFNNSKKTYCCLNLYTEYISSNHMNKISDYEINGVVKYHVTNIFTFMRKQSGTYLLLELIDNSILFLHFIHIIADLMHNSDRFEDYFFKYIFQIALFGIQKLNLNCWTQATIKSFSKFTLMLLNKNNSEDIIQNIWLNFDHIWLKLEDKEIQHFTFSEIIPKFYSKFEDFFREKTNSIIYISALQKCISNDNEIIMNDLLNILFFYLKIGFKENELNQIKSFVFNSNKLNLRIQFNLRLFGIIDFSEEKNISLLDKFSIEDQYQFLILFLNDLSKSDRKYIENFVKEESFNLLVKSFIENHEMQNIFFDVLIICSEFIKSELLLDFISKIKDDYLISKILSSEKVQLRTTFLIYIQFHSSSEKVYDINKNQVLIDFYSLLLSKEPAFIRNFVLITELVLSYYHYDSIPFLRSIFRSILKQTFSVGTIDLILFSTFSFIYFIPKCDYYYDNISLYNSMDDQFHIQNKNLSELSQISLFEYINDQQKINQEALFPLRFSVRIDQEGQWVDKELALLLIKLFETNKKFDIKLNFTKNQAIYGIQMVSMLFVSLNKSDHNSCWDSISFFLKNFPTCNNDFESYKKSAIQIVCYSMVSELYNHSNFKNSFRLFCNRFYVCFENVSQSISSEIFLADDMKPPEMTVIINSFSEVYHFYLLLLKNYGIFLSIFSTDFIKDYCEFMKSLTKTPSIEKIEIFNSTAFINSFVCQFKYENNLNCIKLLNSEGQIEKPFIFFDNSFHPVMFTSFHWKFIEFNDLIDIKNTNKSDDLLIIKHINIINLQGKTSSCFIQRNDTIIIGGYRSKIESIKWVLQRSPNLLEFFYKEGGLMLLVEFDSQLEESFIDQFPTLKEQEVIQNWKNDQISNYDLILQFNFINGRSFNDLDNYVVFPRLLKNVKSHSSMIKEASFRNFQSFFKCIEKEKIQEVHKHFNILNYLNEEQCELIPELFSMSEVSSSLFTKSHIEFLESPHISSQIHLWLKSGFNVDLKGKEVEIKMDKKVNYELVLISKIVILPYDVFDGYFYSVSIEGQLVISKYKNGVLVHSKVSAGEPSLFKNSRIFACPKEKLIAIYRRNFTGFTFYSYETMQLKAKENVIMSSLIEKIGRINDKRFYIITSSKRIIICEDLVKTSCFLEGIDISVASPNYSLNLLMVLCDDGNVIFVSIDSLMFQKNFFIEQNDVKWCILDNKGNSIFASETEIISYDVNGQMLASTKTKRNLTLVSHVVIQNEDFIAIATQKPNLYIINTETHESVYTIKTANPIVAFEFDYNTNIAIVYDNWSTYFIPF